MAHPAWAQQVSDTEIVPASSADTIVAPIPAEQSSAPLFGFQISGFTRIAFEKVQDDEQYDFIGRNDGFVLQNARLHVDGAHRGGWLRFRTGVEGTSEPRVPVNTPEGELNVRVRDAFIRLEYRPWLGVQVGQMLAPFAAEDLRSRRDLLFTRAAVGQAGVPVGRGLQEVSLSTRRQIGVMLNSREPFAAGPVRLNYALMAANGNGENQLLNDNQALALYARLELGWLEYVRVAGALLRNERTAGVRPDQFSETDLGWTVDLRANWLDVHLMAQLARVQTRFNTIEVPDRDRQAWHVEISWRPAIGPLRLYPAYRLANYQPWRSKADPSLAFDFADLDVTEHTMGLGVGDRDGRVRF
ncbi:MAG: hypothetical protein KGO50_08250, partial [Myxococcales bacterium]|nr:hypothetical protein [Myxococcales bacterium]